MPLTNQFHVTSILIILLSPCMHSPGITPFDFHKKQTEILADVFFPHYSEYGDQTCDFFRGSSAGCGIEKDNYP